MNKILLDVSIRIPEPRSSGRQTAQMESRFRSQLAAFATDLKRIQSGLDFHMGARDWCYALEPSGLRKGDFDHAQKLITMIRKEGLIPPGFILEDKKRDFERQIDYDDTPEDFFENARDEYEDAEKTFRESSKYFHAVPIWKDAGFFVQVGVEKAGLESLMTGICQRYHVNLLNMGGFTSIESLASLAQLYATAERSGQTPVLLVCTDHDPVGLYFENNLDSRFKELELFTGWDPKNLIIDRFGLDYDFIEENELTWIDNLESGTKRNLADRTAKYWKANTHGIQDYVEKYGERKVEANAIMVNPDLGRELLEGALLKYLGGWEYEDKDTSYRQMMGRERLEEILQEKLRRREAVENLIEEYFQA